MRLFTRTKTRPETVAAMVQALADQERRAYQLHDALDELVRAIGTAKVNQVLGVPELKRLLAYAEASDTKAALVRSPHDQDPRVQAARQRALRLLGRSI